MGGATCSVARWSPDSRKIACALRTTISVLDADGSISRSLGSFSTPVGMLAWAPDGKSLRFALQNPTPFTYSLWDATINEAGDSEPSRAPGFPTDGSCCAEFAWTRDGKAFMYIAIGADGKARLMAQVGMSSREVQVPAKINIVGGLASARNALYLQIGGASRAELLMFEEKQGVFQALLPGLSADYVSFSKDGQWMSYVNTMDNSLWRSRTDGGEPLQLTTPPAEVEVSSWSPDGQRIAFMQREPGKQWRIYLIGKDGGKAEAVSAGNDNQGGPSWSHDGKSIVYGNVYGEETQDGWLRRVDLASGKVVMIPESHNFRTARWSPDGKYIAALRWQSRELMLFDVRTERWTVLADNITGDNIAWSSNSEFVYADSPRQEKPVVERVRIRDRQRTTAVNLAPLQKVWGGASWVGLTPDNSPILSHLVSASEIYELKWTGR
jgi:Tol biopolymer transport system component